MRFVGMLIGMRKTIHLPDQLHRDLKRFAAEQGKTMTDVIQDAISETLMRNCQLPPKKSVLLPTFKGEGLLPGVDLDDNKALRDLVDGL